MRRLSRDDAGAEIITPLELDGACEIVALQQGIQGALRILHLALAPDYEKRHDTAIPDQASGGIGRCRYCPTGEGLCVAAKSAYKNTKKIERRNMFRLSA